MTHPSPNYLNIERQIEGCSAIGSAVSQSIAGQNTHTQAQAQTQTSAIAISLKLSQYF